jgi:hypothetical protein
VKDRIDDLETRHRALLALMRLLVGVMFTIHFLGGAWHFLGQRIAADGRLSWLGKYCPVPGDECLDAASTWRRYTSSVYFISTTLTSVGYGDILPAAESEQYFAMFVQFSGSVFTALVVSSVISLLESNQGSEHVYRSRMRGVQRLASQYSLPAELRQCLRKWVRDSSGSVRERDEILDELPLALRRDVVLSCYGDITLRVAFFQVLCSSVRLLCLWVRG